jgi:penicillin-binding protein 1A
VRQGKRQPGSTFKALVYATAIDNGFTPCTVVSNTPVTFVTNRGKEYTPQNFDNHYDGQDMTLRQAMGRSINTVAAYLMKEMGADRIASMARRMGVTSQLDEVPSLCLGTSSVSVYEMLGVYSTFVNGGTYTEPIYITRIEDRSGNVLQEFAPKTYEAISEETAYLMLHMLKGALEEEGGTARKLYAYPWSRGNDIGAKTGTTQNYADGWFIGVTHNLVSGLWVGGDEPSIHFRNSTYGQGGRVALPAWATYMDKVYADTTLGITKGLFKKPENLSVSLDCDLYRLPIDSTQTSRLSAGIIK